MADTPKWPGDHAEKHRAAAILGWLRRRGKAPRPEKEPRRHTLRHKKRQAETPAPKPAPAPAPPPAPDTFELIATQKGNGKWIVSRRYKSGRITQEPGEFTVNPLTMKSMQKKPKQVKGQSALFGGDYERSKTYGKGMFDEE